MQEWRKLGLIFRPDQTKNWMQSHASAPVVMHLEESIYRVYFSSRDLSSCSNVGYFDIDLEDPQKILRLSDNPVLSPGPPGYFDGDGVYASSVVKNDDQILMYTIGWNAGAKPHLFYSNIGLAISEDQGETFRKYSTVPIMGRSVHDPCLVTSPVVIYNNDIFRMWYVSGYKWEKINDVYESYYHIKHATSKDGISWERDGHICIDHADPEEKNIARCWVEKEGNRFYAWYSSSRGNGYHIGYAESSNGLDWDRQDNKVEKLRSGEGWDSSAQAYPSVVKYNGRLYMFYNGNNYGKEGIGLAISDR